MHSGRELKVKTAGTDPSRGRDSRPAGRGHLRPSGQPCRSLFVAGIPTTQAERDLHDHFSTYGRLSHVKLLPQNQKSATLAAFVDFDHIDDAILAYETKHLVKGQLLRIEYRHQQPPSRLPADMPHDDRRAPPPSSRSGEPALPPPLHSNRGSPRSDDRYTPHLRNDGRYPPLPCYGNRFDERDRHDDRRGPPSPYSQRYDDRNALGDMTEIRRWGTTIAARRTVGTRVSRHSTEAHPRASGTTTMIGAGMLMVTPLLPALALAMTVGKTVHPLTTATVRDDILNRVAVTAAARHLMVSTMTGVPRPAGFPTTGAVRCTIGRRHCAFHMMKEVRHNAVDPMSTADTTPTPAVPMDTMDTMEAATAGEVLAEEAMQTVGMALAEAVPTSGTMTVGEARPRDMTLVDAVHRAEVAFGRACSTS